MDPDKSLVLAAAETLAAIPYDRRDSAVRRLIEKYCAEIDATGDVEHLGSKLLSALEALQATPRARRGADSSPTAPSTLEAFFDAPRG